MTFGKLILLGAALYGIHKVVKKETPESNSDNKGCKTNDNGGHTSNYEKKGKVDIIEVVKNNPHLKDFVLTEDEKNKYTELQKRLIREKLLCEICKSSNIAPESSLKGIDGNKAVYVWSKQMSGKDVIAMLKKNGWNHLRTSGSHYIMIKNNNFCTVPYHKTIKKGTLANIKRNVNHAENN